MLVSDAATGGEFESVSGIVGFRLHNLRASLVLAWQTRLWMLWIRVKKWITIGINWKWKQCAVANQWQCDASVTDFVCGSESNRTATVNHSINWRTRGIVWEWLNVKSLFGANNYRPEILHINTEAPTSLPFSLLFPFSSAFFSSFTNIRKVFLGYEHTFIRLQAWCLCITPKSIPL